ncbi:hypothetical protein DICVIV_00836, partial [Dictyocaulus viviparus]
MHYFSLDGYVCLNNIKSPRDDSAIEYVKIIDKRYLRVKFDIQIFHFQCAIDTRSSNEAESGLKIEHGVSDGQSADVTSYLHQLEQDIVQLENTLPSISLTTSDELSDFKQAKIPKLYAKLDEISDVPVELLPKKDELLNRTNIISEMLDDQVNNMKKYEDRTTELQDVINECRDTLKAYNDSIPIPFENGTSNVEDLSKILAIIDSIPQEDLSSRNQLARDANNTKEQVKEQLSTLRKALADEDKAREKQNEILQKITAIDDGLKRIDVENPESAQQLIDSIDSDLQKLRGIADNCHQFAMTSSPIISHDDLDRSLPNQINELQNECDTKRKDIEQLVQMNKVAPEILLISESLQQQPDEIPNNLNEQQAVLIDLETKKQRLENLMQTIPDSDATEELRERSAWDLSKLKDLLKKLGDTVGEKLAALATFNAARKDADDQLLRITSPESLEKTPEELRNDEETLLRLKQRISELDARVLDDEKQDEHAQLLDRIDKTLDTVKQRRDNIEEEIARRSADIALQDKVIPISCRLVQLVNDANRLLSDAEGVPSQYRPCYEELINECKNADTILRDAPKNHPCVETLNAAIASANNVIPILEDRA